MNDRMTLPERLRRLAMPAATLTEHYGPRTRDAMREAADRIDVLQEALQKARDFVSAEYPSAGQRRDAENPLGNWPHIVRFQADIDNALLREDVLAQRTIQEPNVSQKEAVR